MAQADPACRLSLVRHADREGRDSSRPHDVKRQECHFPDCHRPLSREAILRWETRPVASACVTTAPSPSVSVATGRDPPHSGNEDVAPPARRKSDRSVASPIATALAG
ncbi:MAG: hypothetical protein IJR99_07305 [Kiritimatiellae bacterium]|nr:hypothetical protein [Kiritimatiellia bacterium]